MMMSKLKYLNSYFSKKKKYLNAQVLHTVVCMYIYYQLNNKVTRLSNLTDNLTTSLVDSISIAVDKTVVRLFDIYLQKFTNQNNELLNIHLSRMDKMNKDLLLKSESMFNNTSDKTGKLILDLYLKQSELAANMSTSHVSVIQQSNSSKFLVITTLIILSACLVGAYFYIPKIITLTQTQFYKLVWLKSELLRLIPGSNTAEGSIHLRQYAQFKINTKIESGIPELTIINTHTNETQCLLDFIDNLLINSASSSGSEVDSVINTCQVVTQAGALLDITKYMV